MAGVNVSSPSPLTIAPACYIFREHPERCDTLVAVRRTFGAIGLIGCVFIIFVIWLFKKYKAFSQRLILYMSVAGFFVSTAYLMGGLLPDGPMCEFQGFWMQMFHWAVLLWVSCITFNLFVNVVWQKTTEKYEWVYHAVCWGVSLFMSCLPFIGDHYGPAGAWCWIVNDWRWRFGVWYGPQIIIIIILMICYISLSCVLSRKASRWEGTYDPDTERAKQLMKEDIKPLRLYPFIYLAISIFPLVNRVQNAIDDEHPNFGLMILQAIFSPAQGFLNAVVFAMDRETFSRLTPSQIKIAFLNRFGKKALIQEFNTETLDPETEY